MNVLVLILIAVEDGNEMQWWFMFRDPRHDY